MVVAPSQVPTLLRKRTHLEIPIEMVLKLKFPEAMQRFRTLRMRFNAGRF